MMKWFTCVLVFCFIFELSSGQYLDDLRGSYCRSRSPQVHCCPGRDDTCTVPILGTVCYCDMFCNRTNSADCCPDFKSECLGIVTPPEPIVRAECLYNGRYYKAHQTIKINCNRCTCQQKSSILFDFVCEQNVCLVRPELISAINEGYNGWRASNYSFLYGKSLDDGIKQRLGTFKPTKPTMEMNEIHPVTNGPLPESFDSRQKWTNKIQPIRDQGDCAASWAFSTTAVASDRLAIESLGQEMAELSPQHLLSCQKRGQRACHGGHLDKAWYFLRKKGVTTSSCFPYSQSENYKCPFTSKNHDKVRCPTGGEDSLYRSTPPYRVGPKEDEIMREIYFNGPVQATFRVQPDFFLYNNGVYRHVQDVLAKFPQPFRQHDWHSVRILGWGEETIDGKRIKYWRCANSWGTEWGEDGHFRIVKGEDECDIEMFVVGVWAHLKFLNNL